MFLTSTVFNVDYISIYTHTHTHTHTHTYTPIHTHYAAAAAKSLQSCPTSCDPIDAAHQDLCPWDSPGNKTGVGCHFLLQGKHARSVASVVSDCVRSHGQQPTRLLCPWEPLGKNTGVGCHFLLQLTHYKRREKRASVVA